MHTATFFNTGMFSVTIDEAAATPQALLNWGPQDRLGLVVTSSFGGLGASLLTQLATSVFYDEPGKGRRDGPVYPDIYCFHVGGRYGNHGAFDFAPSRKEVIVETSDVLGVINSHGITHLVVPDGPAHTIKHGFKEPEAAADRIKACFAYGHEGAMENADVVICSTEPWVLRNSQMTLRPEEMMADLASRTWSSPEEHEDKQSVVQSYRDRAYEVGEELRAHKIQRFVAAELTGKLEESYRRVSLDFALSRLRAD